MELRDRVQRLLLLFTAFSVTFVGCGRPAHELETAPVSGKVSLDGEVLPQGIVYVIPTKGRMAKGLIQEDGTFELSTYNEGDGAQVGKHPTVVAALPRDELDANQKQQRVAVPRRYSQARTSGLIVEVQAGENNEVELVLSSEAENR